VTCSKPNKEVLILFTLQNWRVKPLYCFLLFPGSPIAIKGIFVFDGKQAVFA